MPDTGPNGLPLCAVCREREVPRHEWPSDPTLPKVCDPCLRASALRPPRAPQQARVAEPAKATGLAFGGDADFTDSPDFE